MGTFLLPADYAAVPIQGIGYVIQPWPTKTVTTTYQPSTPPDHEPGVAYRSCSCVYCLTVWRVERGGYLTSKLGALAAARYAAIRERLARQYEKCQHVTDASRSEYHERRCRWCYLGDPRYIDDPVARKDARELYGLFDKAWGYLKNDWREHHKAGMKWAAYQRMHGLVAAEHWQWERRMLAGIYWSEEPTYYGPNLRSIFLMMVLRASTRAKGHPGIWVKGERLAHGVITRKGRRLIGVPKQTAHDWYNGTDWDEVERLWDDYAAPRCEWPREPELYGSAWAAEDGATAWEDVSGFSDRSPV